MLARYGVLAVQWCDFMALVGDRSDGLPGVRGVGPVRASLALAGGATLDHLADGRLSTFGWGHLVADALVEATAQREVIRLTTDVAGLPRLTGRPSPPLPLAAAMVEAMGLW